jgi:hypothetical protein
MSANFHELLTEAFPEMRPPRRNLRFPSDEAPPVKFTDDHGQEIIGILENESYSGIAAIIEQEFGLKMNAQIDVDYFGRPMPGFVRRLEVQPDGAYLLGIEWK